MNELLDVDPELQIHFAASQIHSALRQLGNDLAQDNLPLRKTHPRSTGTGWRIPTGVTAL